jgi:ribosomal RNA-processing protein 8
VQAVPPALVFWDGASVLACDMAATGMADEVLDVAVFFLSLMGLIYREYLQEAHRLLRYGGWLKVAESASRWGDNKLEQLKGAICGSGFSMVGKPTYKDRFIYLNAIKS